MRLLAFAVLLALLPFSQAQAQAEEDHPAYGVWLTDNGKSKVHVNKCDGKLCSTIIWLKDAIDEATGQPHLDDNNQDLSLRDRPVVGLNVLDRMTQTARYEWEGEVYNPEDGKKYKAYLAMIKPNVMRLKGCMPMGWPCRSKFWKKLDEEPPAPPEQMMAETEDGPSGEGPQLAQDEAAETIQQAQVTTQSVAEGAKQAANDARAAAPQSLTPPVQLTPLQQAKSTPETPPNQIARAPEPPALPQLSPPAPPAAPQVAAPPIAAPKIAVPRITAPKIAAPDSVPPEPAAPGKSARIQADREIGQQARRVPDMPAPPPPADVRSNPQQRQAMAPPPPPPPPPPSAFNDVAPAPSVAPRPRMGRENRQFAALPPQNDQPRASNGERYLVQVAARKNEKEAMQIFYDLRQRNPQLLGDVRPIIKRVDLGDLGVWYRVRVGPITGKAAALAFCNRLKFAGSDCFIRRQ